MNVRLVIIALIPFYTSTAWALVPPSNLLRTTTRSCSDSKFHQIGLRSHPSHTTAKMVILPKPSTFAIHEHRQSLKGTIVSVMHGAASAVKREIEMTCGLLQSDAPVTIILGTVSTIAFGAARTSPLPSYEWVLMILKAFFWFFGYGYFFDIGNQMNGIEEDKLNGGDVSCKANRPLATGAMSLEEGKIRHVLSGIYYMVVSWTLGHVELSLCALLWIVSCQLHNFGGWSNHFATKNYCIMSTGSIAMLLGARAIAEENQFSMIPPILTAVWIGLCMDCQDLRDEAGDRISGRRTTSVLLGVDAARKAWVVMTSLSTGLLMYIMNNCICWLDVMVVTGIIILMARTLSNKTAKEDHHTYNGICLAGFAFFVRSAFWAQTF